MSEARVPQQARGEERRERIVRATLAVAGRSGIAAVTHRSVAEEAGVPLGSLTYWFATKDDLLSAALRRFVEEEADRLRVVAARLGPDSPPADVAAEIGRALGDTADGDTVAQFELYLEAARNPALREIAEECFRAYDEVAIAALRALGIPDAAQVGPLFVSLTDGLELRRGATGDAPRIDRLMVALFELLR